MGGGTPSGDLRSLKTRRRSVGEEKKSNIRCPRGNLTKSVQRLSGLGNLDVKT